ncbi:unnamed protein product [Closterium sp. NIES-53]
MSRTLSMFEAAPQLLPGSLLPAPAPHTEVIESVTERREPETRASAPVRARRVVHVLLLSQELTVWHFVLPLFHIVLSFLSLPRPLFCTFLTLTFALVTELVDFATGSHLDYIASLVTESESVCPPSIGSEPALGSDVLEDRQFELECLAAALPCFASILLCPE